MIGPVSALAALGVFAVALPPLLVAEWRSRAARAQPAAVPESPLSGLPPIPRREPAPEPAEPAGHQPEHTITWEVPV